MRRVTRLSLALLQVAGHVLAAEAVADGTDLLDAKLGAQVLNGGLDDGVHLGRVWHLVLDPLHEVEALGRVQRHHVAVEEVRDHGEVAVGSILVGDTRGWTSALLLASSSGHLRRGVAREVCAGRYEVRGGRWGALQLHVYKVDAEDVSEDDDGVLGRLVLGVGEVGADCCL